jgi:TatD DNase family protein
MLFDVHAHLTHEAFAGKLPELLERARQAGLGTIVSNGLNPRDNQAVLDLAAQYPIVKPALGLYPVDAVLVQMRAAGEEYPDQREAWDGDEAVDWVEAHLDQAFAVGEIGLDGYWVKEAHWAEQERLFRRLVGLAMAADKAVIIHTRKRERRAFEILVEMGARRVNWHCFGGKVNLARSIAEQGHYLSIPANARRSESFTRMLQTLPRERVLLETDCPYLGPERDSTNEPMNVRGTAQYAAELWGCDVASVEDRLQANFQALFGVAP